MRALLVTEEVLAAVSTLIEKAAAQPTPYKQVAKLAAAYKRGVKTNPLHRDMFTIVIPHGFRVTYTHEYQRPDVVCRHMSVSADDAKPGSGPNPAAVSLLMEMFGFKNLLGALPMWLTTGEAGETIVEMVEPLDGDVMKLSKQVPGTVKP